MSDVDVLFPKLLSQTLGQRPQTVLASRKGACDNVASQTGRCSRENEDPPLSVRLLNIVLFERQNSFPREGEGGSDVGLERGLHFFWGDVEEGLPDSVARVENGGADVVLWGRVLLSNGTPS